MTKTGKPFGQVTIEDYSDSHTLFLFSDSYLKFKNYLEKGWFLYVSGSVQNRWKSAELEFKVHNIEYLGEIREKMIKGLELQIDIKAINDFTMDELEHIVNDHPGNDLLKFCVLGSFEDKIINLELLSRKLKVTASNQLIDALEGMEEFRFRVLT
jgi:DNA polymerase-3 subunit alpha